MRTGAAAGATLLAWAVVGGWGRGAAPSPPAHGVGVIHAAGPPAAHTGGFGEPTCLACHTEYPLNAPGGSLSLEGLPDAWAPGVRYPLVVLLTSEEMGAAGFQLSARFDDGRPAGTLQALSPRVAVVDSGGMPYAQHAPGGTAVETPEVARWLVEWVAPPGGGAVTLHAAANSANGDNSPFGDLVYAGSWRVRAAPIP